MDTVQEIISFFGLPVTAYALCLTAALCAALALLAAQCRRLSLRPGTALTMALWMLPLGLAGARLFYCLARLSFFMEVGLGSMLKMWNGGFALWGALGGAVLGAVIAARQTHQRPALLLDALAAPGALAIALCRLAEYFSGEGIGMYVEDERFCFFPLAVCNQYEEWYWAIFLLEALVALVILGVLLRRARPAGDSTAVPDFVQRLPGAAGKHAPGQLPPLAVRAGIAAYRRAGDGWADALRPDSPGACRPSPRRGAARNHRQLGSVPCLHRHYHCAGIRH